MARRDRIKTEGGSGGKRGHSNMTHWSPTEFIKRETRKARRRIDKHLSKEDA